MTEVKPMLAALGRIPSGLFIVTFRQGEEETGLLASWLQQCSFQPLRLSMALKSDRQALETLSTGAQFTVNILDHDQTDMIAHFGRGFQPGDSAFHDLNILRPNGAPPVLEEALAFLVCRVVSRLSAGDHDILIADVTAGQVLNEGQPMVHIRKTASHY